MARVCALSLAVLFVLTGASGLGAQETATGSETVETVSWTQLAGWFSTPKYPPDHRYTPPTNSEGASPSQAKATGTGEEPPTRHRSRFYVGLFGGGQVNLDTGFAPGLELSSAETAIGALLGFNIGRYVGLELATDFAESDLKAAGFGKVAEFSQFNLIPQVRVRYPLIEDRLTGYLVGGVGYGQTEVNDKQPAAARPGAPVFTGASTDNSLVYAIGAGVDYFIADNIALTFDLKYTQQSARVSVDGRGQDVDLKSFRALAGTRLLFPGPPRATPATPTGGSLLALDPGYARPYATFQIGPSSGMGVLEEDIGSGLSFDSEVGAADPLVFGLGLGYDINRHLGVELVGNTQEKGITTSRADLGTKTLVEHRINTVLTQIRARYPLLQDRLVPYVLAGVGLGHSATNDSADETILLALPVVEGDHVGLAASLGAGLEYFVADNMAIGAELKYIYHRPDLKVDGRRLEINADSLLGVAGIRVYF